MQEHIAEMKRRTDLGEFGTPADTILVHEAWARILEQEIAKKETRFEDISGLWKPKRESTKVAFEGRTRDNLEIPKGSKIIAFYNRSDSEGVPHFNLVWVVNEN
mgnify:FL=1|jgi:hypothetical protein